MAEPTDESPNTIRAWLESKSISRCGLCGAGEYDIENYERVFLMSSVGGAQMGKRKPQRGGSVRFDPVREIQEEIDHLRSQLHRFRSPAEHRQLMKLGCDNCGNTVLLDANKVGVAVKYSPY